MKVDETESYNHIIKQIFYQFRGLIYILIMLQKNEHSNYNFTKTHLHIVI